MKHIKKFNEQIDFNQSHIDEVIKYLDLNFEFNISYYLEELHILCMINDKGHNILNNKTYVRRKLLNEIEGVFDYDTSLLNKAIKEFLNTKEKEYLNLKFDDLETLHKKIIKYFDILKIDYSTKSKRTKDYDQYIIKLSKNDTKIDLISYYNETPSIYIRFQKSIDNYITGGVPNFNMLIKYLFKHKLIDSKNLILKMNDK